MDINEQFCENVRMCEGAMYALARSMMKNDQDAADAISESILKAYRNIDQLKNFHAFKSWMLKIVNNTCLDMLRKRRYTVDIEEQYDLEDDSSNQDVSMQLAVRDAVEQLNQPYRTVVVLYYFESLSLFEISKVTGSSVGAVKTQLSRARGMLRNSLNKEDFF